MNKRQAKKQSLYKRLLYEHRKLDKKYFRDLRKSCKFLDDMRIVVLRQQILKEMGEEK